MAQRLYTLNLQNTKFPMLSEQITRTTMLPSEGDTPTAGTKPHIEYCHNVMPSEYGMDSVAYLHVVDDALDLLPAGLTFTDVRVVFGDARSRLYLALDTEGNVYALLGGSASWIAVPPTVPATSGPGFDPNTFTVATVNGVSYMFYSTIGAFIYNEVTNTLDEVILDGLTVSDLLGVVGSSGYLIAYTNEAIAWSSTILPTDFIPSQVTGAGGGNVAGIAGDILFAVSNPLGIIIHTEANAIAGTFTGNVAFPFKFREIDNSKGGISLDLVAYEANSKRQFIYSKAGLQSVTTQAAEAILPEVTDFLAGKRFEDFNETTLAYEITDLDANTPMKKKIKFIASRYLVVSYGITSFTHALVLDVALQKLGKLRISHVDVFEYVGSQTEISRESFAFALPTGEVQVIDFSASADASGVLIAGKLQYNAAHMIKLVGVELENVELANTLDVTSMVAIKGKVTSNTQGVVRTNEEGLREFMFNVIGKTHSLIFKGKFNLTTALIRYVLAGRR